MIIEELGLCQSPKSPGSSGCAESSLLSHLSCQSPYPSDAGQGRHVPRLHTFESVLCTIVSRDPACVHSVTSKHLGEILISVSVLERACFSPTCPHAFRLHWPHVERLLDHSFRQSHLSLSDPLSVEPTFIYSVPVSPLAHHLSC